MALKEESGNLQGSARVLRDFSERHERVQQLQRTRARLGSLPAQTTIVGIVPGEVDRVIDAHDAFLQLDGCSREDLMAG
jgi:PAS domain-containing protein